MGVSDVCPTEDAVCALLDYLVDPMLPAKSSPRDTPSISQLQSVAKQVHAVVLLYNYYHRKQNPQLECLGFEPFCKLAVLLKPSLMAHMKLMQRSNDTELDELEKQFSLTEKAVMDACDIAMSLDASKDVPSTKGWAISKVLVFLIDSKKENCLLQFCSITQGVWSAIEKDMDVSNDGSEGTMEGKFLNKKKRVTKKLPIDKSGANEDGFHQLAFSAVKDAAGINQSDLTIIESHVVYSLSKEKTAARFYIMQCTQSNNDDAIQIPIKDAIDSLPGPLVRKSSGQWIATSVVEYFHLLPCAGIVSDWLSREVFSSSLQDQKVGLGIVNENRHEMTEKPCEPEVHDGGHKPHANGSIVECLGSKMSCANTKSLKQKDNNGLLNAFDGPHNMEVDDSSVIYSQNEDKCKNVANKVHDNGQKPHANGSIVECLGSKMSCANTKSLKQKDNSGLLNAFDGPHNMEVDDSSVIYSQNEDKCKNIGNKVQPENQQKMTTPYIGRDLNGSTSGVKQVEKVDLMVVSRITECRGENVANGNKICDKVGNGNKICVNVANGNKICDNVANGNKICDNILSDPYKMPVSDHALVTYRPNYNDLEKLQTTIASKENALSQTALRVLLSKRDKLTLQQRKIEDEIAQCDKNIQTILNGGEDDLALKIETVIEGCNDVCLRSITQESSSQHLEDQCSPQHIKRKRLSEAVLGMPNPIQELDGICYQNNWILPTYCVSPSDGGFQAKVTVKGMDFVCSSGGELRPNPQEARESSAAQMLAKLRSLAIQAQ